MAIPRHLDIVLAGPIRIEQWRRENPNQDFDLSDANLEGENLVNCDLSGANLLNGKLARANLSGANLTGADLSGTDLQGASLMGTDLTDAYLVGAWLIDVALNDSIICRTDFSWALMKNVQLVGAELDNTAILMGADLTNADFDGTTGLIFDQNHISGTRISPHMGDPWSILKSKYSGPKMVLHLILFGSALAPFCFEALWWLYVARAQQQYELSNFDGPTYPLALVAIGWHRGLLATALSVVVILYNIFRGFITLKFSTARDLEDRLRVTPAASSYLYLYRLHRFSIVIVIIVLAITVWRVARALSTTVQLPQ